VIIVGAGGHGLATAYYLAKEHGITNVAVIEKGWLGGGNTGRNTTIIRSNYLYDESARHLRARARNCGRAVAGAELQRHVFAARRDDAGAQRARHSSRFKRHIHANRLNGIDNRMAHAAGGEGLSARRSTSRQCPLSGPRRGALQRRGGTARHDAVAWGYARAADGAACDIIQNCEVTGIRRDADGDGRSGSRPRGLHRPKKVGVVGRRPHSVLMQMADVRCRWKAIRSRRWCRSRSSRSSPAW
jgi:sarcosine oxidase subunit beta